MMAIFRRSIPPSMARSTVYATNLRAESDLVALVEQGGLQEDGEGIGVGRRSAHGFKLGLDATASRFEG